MTKPTTNMKCFSRMKYLLVLLVLIYQISMVIGYDKEMTVHVPAGKMECFYHDFKKFEKFELEYQVNDGGHGDLDISFTMLDPIGIVIVSDFKKPENIHRHNVEKDGDYRFCFDNTFSSFNRKTVFFALIVEREGEQNLGDMQWNESLESLSPEEYYDMKVQDIKAYIARIRTSLTKAQQFQEVLRSFEARDRNLAEKNFQKVNWWSIFQTFLMVVVGLLQVFMLRSIFETNSRMSKFWKKVNF